MLGILVHTNRPRGLNDSTRRWCLPDTQELDQKAQTDVYFANMTLTNSS